MKKKKRTARRDEPREPTLVDDDWVEWGGELIWAVGFTSGGAPYGLTEEEFYAAPAQGPEAERARAKRILEDVFTRGAAATPRIDIGHVREGRTRSRDVFAAEVQIVSGTESYFHEIAILLPSPAWAWGCDPDDDRELEECMRKEARILAALRAFRLPFRVPSFFGICTDSGHLALVRSFERGEELDVRPGRQHGVRPPERVAKIAAAIHGIEARALPGLRPRYATRLDHARGILEGLDEMAEPEIADARAWMAEHLPPATPSTLVHGNLLGANIVFGLDEPDTVIDWEHAQSGDPAYDLAIATRGVRRPFRNENGMDRLMEAYERAGGHGVKRSHVHFHELGLAACGYRDGLNGGRARRAAAQQQLQFLRSLLRRLSMGRG